MTASAPVTRIGRDGGGWKVEALVGEKPVSWLYINDLRWRVGSSVVRMGGIGGVATPKEHRNKGYSRICMEAALVFMVRKGIPMSALFGIPGFYPKWGFAPVIPEPRLSLSPTAGGMLRSIAPYRVAAFDRVRHGPTALRLYRANNRTRSGTIIPRAGRTPLRKGSDWFVKADGFALLSGGAVAGYAAYDAKPPGMTVTEVGWRTTAVFPALTAEITRRARARKTDAVRMLLPLDHPYALWLRRWNVEHGAAYYADGQGMARIIRLADTLRACAGEFTRRLSVTRFVLQGAAVGLATDIGTVTLSVRRGRLAVREGGGRGLRVRVPQAVLTQWLLGALPVGVPSPAGRSSIPRHALPFLQALFPGGQPYLWHSDRF